MKKVKEMATCMETGKVCFRVREAYNQLVEVILIIEALEDSEQNCCMAYDIAHTAMTAKKVELSKQVHKTCLNCEVEVAKQALKKAEKAEREAVRYCDKVYDFIWSGSADYIAASAALTEAYDAHIIAEEVLKVKQELFNAVYK